MTKDSRDLYTIAEAAEAWGISRQAAYKRLSTIDNQVDNQAFIVVKGKQRYITRDCIEAYRGEASQVDNQPTTKRQPTDNQLTTEVDRLTRALLEAQGRASLLQATVDAQRAHIDSLQAALDKTQTALNQEQALHMASLQQRLPAGRGRFMDWIRGRRGED